MRDFEQMTRDEFIGLLLDCAEVFRADPPSEKIVSLWWETLGHLDAFFLRKSFAKHLRTGRFFPTIAEIGSGVWHDPQWILEDTTWARGVDRIDPADSRFDLVRETVTGRAIS